MPDPENLKEVRSLLGMTGYYRQCMPNYAHVVEPLVSLTRKDVPFKWDLPQIEAVQKLKELLTSGHVMAFPDISKPYTLFTDASDKCIGGILVQEDKNGVERVIQYVSQQLKGSQLNWATIQKECWAVVACVTKLRPYLLGAEFKVVTDHKPLRSIFTGMMRNTTIQRWAVLLAEYGAKIEYRKGANNIRADMLSRLRPPVDESEEMDVDALDYLNPEADRECHPDRYVPWEWFDLSKKDVQERQKTELSEQWADAQIDNEGYLFHEGLLYSNKAPSPHSAIHPRLVLPPSLARDMVTMLHKEVGHMGVQKTMDKVREIAVWPGMRRFIQIMIDRCPECKLVKARPEKTPYGEMPIPTYPFQVISMDLIGPLIKSRQGHCYVLNIVDHLSGWAESYTC